MQTANPMFISRVLYNLVQVAEATVEVTMEEEEEEEEGEGEVAADAVEAAIMVRLYSHTNWEF